MDNAAIDRINESATSRIAKDSTLKELDETRVEFLGKNGEITNLMKNLGSLEPENRKSFGMLLNNLKNYIANKIDAKKNILEKIEIDKILASEKIDLSLPVRQQRIGRIHPLSQVIDEVVAIFGSMGFAIASGPSIEDEYHNFTALNIPELHPARQMHDSFYLKDSKMLLRTHTSPIQIRSMKNNKPPFRFLAPDRCYRFDWDQTHTPMFHQVELLLIDKHIHMGHLKGCINEFMTRFFELSEVPLRFRASYFPFTEPSAEVDVRCQWKNKELIIGSGNDWLEILGCGMVHPMVLKNVGLDPEEYRGFALGMGLERIAMLKYGISDLRTFFESDLRWLNHYGFSAFDIPSLIGGLTR